MPAYDHISSHWDTSESKSAVSDYSGGTGIIYVATLGTPEWLPSLFFSLDIMSSLQGVLFLESQKPTAHNVIDSVRKNFNLFL